jgi:hypothetical protein
MTHVKYFDDVSIFPHPVIYKNGAMMQFSNAGPFSDCATHAGEPAQQVHVVEQSASKTPGGFAIILGNMPDDFSEIA